MITVILQPIEIALLLYERKLLHFGKAKAVSGLDILALLGRHKIELPVQTKEC